MAFTETVLKIDTSLLLILLLGVTPIPLVSADLSTGIVGTITGFGTLYLRGIELRQVGTLFSGDNIQTGDQSPANLILANGSRVQLAGKTRFVTTRNSQVVKLSLIAGEIAFTTFTSPVTIVCSEYQITPAPDSSGGVAMINADFAAVRVANGRVTLRNSKDKSVVELSPGSERILTLRTGQQQAFPVQLASTMPTRIPAGQQGQVGGKGINWALWETVIGGVAVATVVIVYEVTKCTQASPSAPCK